MASEIDESAIRLVRNRHPGVVHVGDITKFTVDDVIRHGPFDLVMGGSPCNDLSGANPRRRGLYGKGICYPDSLRLSTQRSFMYKVCHECNRTRCVEAMVDVLVFIRCAIY